MYLTPPAERQDRKIRDLRTMVLSQDLRMKRKNVALEA